MAYFKLGVKGEGYTFFLPDSYKNDEQIIGTTPRRTISGKYRRDVITTKRQFTLVFSYMTELEVATIYAQFEKNIKLGKDLTFIDDQGKEYLVGWGQQNFGLNERTQSSEVHWSGTIVLEEV
ncbi:hypothetical protein [Microcystis phage MaeS]|nr:hypothetical protein [Microcystis phage MaeS]